MTRWSWVLLAAACRPAVPPAVTAGPATCHVPPDPAVQLDTVTVAFPERENAAGRLVLRLSGETLIGVDCAGQVRPFLATRWTHDAAGTTWSFQLDTILTADSLAAQWDRRRNGGLWPWSRILEVRAVSPRQLEIRLDTAFASVPAAFALPELSAVPIVPVGGPVLRIEVPPAAVDERDLLDRSPAGGRGSDVLITRNRATISYAGSKPGFSVVPLAWDRTYVIVAPLGRPALGSAEDGLKQTLVREVIRSDSRVAEPPFWWESMSCGGTTPRPPMGRRAEVVYSQDDETAREIAERLVALQPAPLRAVGLTPAALGTSLAAGEAAMYVVSLPRTPPGRCGNQPAWPSQSSVVPLVDGRAHAIVRAGVPGFTIEGDGTFRFDLVLRPARPIGPGQ